MWMVFMIILVTSGVLGVVEVDVILPVWCEYPAIYSTPALQALPPKLKHYEQMVISTYIHFGKKVNIYHLFIPTFSF